MKNFLIRIGCWFVCLFVINFIIALIAPEKSAGLMIILLSFLTAEALARAIINKAEKSIFICILVVFWVIFALMILVD